MCKHYWKATVLVLNRTIENEQTLYISELLKLLVVKWDQYATLLSEIEEEL